MPTCTVDRNCVGALASASAAVAHAIAVFGPLLQPHLAGGDDGDLRHREDAVGQQQHEHDDDFGADAAHRPELYCSPSRQPGATRSRSRPVGRPIPL